MLVKLFIHVFLLDDLFNAISEVIDIDSLWLVTVKSFHNLWVEDHPSSIDWLEDVLDLRDLKQIAVIFHLFSLGHGKALHWVFWLFQSALKVLVDCVLEFPIHFIIILLRSRVN